MTSTLINELYKSRNNLLEQLKRQGYDVLNHTGASIDEINSMYTQQQLDMTLTTTGEEEGESRTAAQKRTVHVHYYLAGGLRPAGLANLVDQYFVVEGSLVPKVDSLIVLVRTVRDINDTLELKVKEIWEHDGIFVTMQSLDRLQYQVLDHEYVPPHRILAPAELAKVMAQYEMRTTKEFPTISRNDPVAKAIGIRPGEVCEIMRASKTAIVAPYYRVCINE